ncbi:MAG: serine acetyltransferase [Prevotella sp.]|jgi:serine O-acetyltransferase|nr:serine acetyltransferase [Prevotella sp.]MBR4192119.1 serine acetyltransferase [Prevotella sp.]
MDQKKINETLRSNVAILSKHTDDELRMMPTATLTQLPSVEDVKRIISLIKSIVFSDYFHKRQPDEELRAYQIGVSMEELYRLLRQQIARGLQFCEECAESDVLCAGEELALKFIDALPEIKRLLYTDIQAMFDNDPAAATYGEVIFCYPVVNTMTHYRVAHKLHEMQVPVIPRIITEQAHSKTGIDIHPGAQIGEYFSIDHGTGVVIGETSIIGNHVTLYQGVTLGAKSFKYDEQGNMLNVPRHPIIEDNVTVYSNASILGRITIGHDSVIGGNIWLTHSVPPYSRILQSKAVDVSFQDGLGI